MLCGEFLEVTLNTLLEEEKRLSQIIAKSDSFEEIEKLISLINEEYRKKGEYENVISQLTEVEGIIDKCKIELGEIDTLIFSKDFEQTVKTQINKFNKFFSNISDTLYGEKYALKYDIITNKKKQQLYQFSAFNANLSSGKKQGEILCFDIAYVFFTDKEDIPCLHLLLNDKKELMHDNQLVKINDYIQGKDIQFVASILKDKLPEQLKQEKYYVVELSQDNKLFKIESSDL
jgi:hypothetical protein